jgi:DNA-binding winged helix-turn-helix (wHTH) protein
MLKSVRYQVGHWTFVPSAHELRSGGDRARLQQRASATLSLLCERAGEVVSRQEIIDRAWGRQHLSPNSVAIVIGDLRRALGLGGGEPGAIETLPKAGYRLVPTRDQPPADSRHSRLPFAAEASIAISLVALAALAVQWHQPAAAKPEVALGVVENAMGTPLYAPLMSACSETVLVALGRHSNELRIVEAPLSADERPDYVLQQRWVLWSGDPELVLVARDRRGQTVWSGAIYGPENQFPAKISDKIAQFAALSRGRHGSS